MHQHVYAAMNLIFVGIKVKPCQFFYITLEYIVFRGIVTRFLYHYTLAPSLDNAHPLRVSFSIVSHFVLEKPFRSLSEKMI